MTTLVVGASGATGSLLVAQLLERGQSVRAIVRSPGNLPEYVRNHQKISLIEASILDLSDVEMAGYVGGCHAVASCLGHNLSLKGIYGQPRSLVTESVRRLCRAIESNKPAVAIRFVLMNTTGNSNRDLAEKISLGEKFVIGLLRLLLPPHTDNENAADFLRTEIGQNDRFTEWAAVRPDALTDEGVISEYELHPSPIRSAIFNAGKSSRINVGHFMAELMTNEDVWKTWKGRMPVIYNKASK
jgi:hypothetical protein